MSKKYQNKIDNNPNVKKMVYPCTGIMGPASVRVLAENSAKGVIIGSCACGDCHYREGNVWLEQRILAERKPRFKKIEEPFSVYQLRFNSAQSKNFLKQVDDICLDKNSTEKKPEETFPQQKENIFIRYIKYGNPFVNLTFSSFVMAVIFFGLYFFSTATPRAIEVDQHISRIYVDFYLLTSKKSCDDTKIKPEDIEAAKERFSGLNKYDQLTPEAQERLTRYAIESVKEKYCSRERLPLNLKILIDEKISYDQTLQPKGIAGDSQIHINHKLDIGTGFQKVNFLAQELDNGKPNGVEYKLEIAREFAATRVYYVDFEKSKNQLVMKEEGHAK